MNSRRAAAYSPAVGDAVEATSDGSPAPQERAFPPAPVGVSAPVIAPAYTNFTTGIAGRVTLRGEPPPEKPIDMSGSPCAKLQTNSPTTRFFAVGPDGGLADVIVSIVGGLDRKHYEAPQTNHELAFVSCQIQPYVSAVMTDQWIAFRNTDRTPHVPHLTPTNNPERSFALDQKSATHLLRINHPENLIRIKCDVHPWEFAYVSVLEHPFFAITDTNGNFVIPNIPAGKYTLRALHRKAPSTNEITREIKVNRGEISLVNLTLDAPAK